MKEKKEKRVKRDVSSERKFQIIMDDATMREFGSEAALAGESKNAFALTALQARMALRKKAREEAAKRGNTNNEGMPTL